MRDVFYLSTLALFDTSPLSSLWIFPISPLISFRIFYIQGWLMILAIAGR